MIQLRIENINAETTAHLQTKQADVDGQPGFAEKAQRAKTLWDGKSGSQAGAAAFANIKEKLKDMCVGTEICNYCENNEATDVEHLYPKKLYPESVFQWSNYILACKTCNTTWKSDKFAVLDPAGSDALFEIPQQRGVHTQPANNDGALTNPRAEDPTAFLLLDICGRTFRFSANLGISNRDKVRADYTLSLLGLNNRNALVEARRAAANHYLDRLEKFIRVKNAQCMRVLDAIAADPDAVDETQSLQQEKDRIMNAIINDIKTYAHPTVWAELKRQRMHLPRTNRLFSQAPEALTW